MATKHPKNISIAFEDEDAAGKASMQLNLLLRSTKICGKTRHALNAIFVKLAGRDHDSIGNGMYRQ